MRIRNGLFYLFICGHLVACNSDKANAAETGGVSAADLQALATRITTLEANHTEQQEVIARLESDLVAADWQASAERITALETSHSEQQVVIAQLESALTDANAKIAEMEVTLANVSTTGLAGRVASLEDTLTCASFDETENDFILDGCNVHIRDGSGSTATTTGFGNLIIGYDVDLSGSKNKTGSHNLIIGDDHSYSSYGGLIAGYENTLSAPYAAITGGMGNSITADYGSIVGGESNTVAAQFGSISGGQGNSANGSHSSISGGSSNALNVADSWLAGDIRYSANKVEIDTTIFEVDAGASGSINAATLDITAAAITNIRGSLIQLNNGGQPAARLGSLVSVSGTTGTIVNGSATVLIGN